MYDWPCSTGVGVICTLVRTKAGRFRLFEKDQLDSLKSKLLVFLDSIFSEARSSSNRDFETWTKTNFQLIIVA